MAMTLASARQVCQPVCFWDPHPVNLIGRSLSANDQFCHYEFTRRGIRGGGLGVGAVASRSLLSPPGAGFEVISTSFFAMAAAPPPNQVLMENLFFSHLIPSRSPNFHFPLSPSLLKLSSISCQCAIAHFSLPLGMELIWSKSTLRSRKGFHLGATFVSAEKAPSEFLSRSCLATVEGRRSRRPMAQPRGLDDLLLFCPTPSWATVIPTCPATIIIILKLLQGLFSYYFHCL